MKRNFDDEILDLDGQPVRAGATRDALNLAIQMALGKLPNASREVLAQALDKAAGAPLTLKAACLSALLAVYEDERQLAPEEKVKRMELARKLYKGGILEISPAERDTLKPLINKCFAGVLVPVVACELLEKEPPRGIK